MRSYLLSLLFICSLLIPRDAVRGQNADAEGPSFVCGLNAAYMFLNKTGHHVSYSDLQCEWSSETQPDSLLAIKSVLGRHGCATVGIKTDADFFLKNKGMAIVHLRLSGFGPMEENHFSLLLDATRQGGAEMLDPIFDVKAAAFLTWDGFSRAFQGTALILK